jgi:fatty acid desaturase
MNYHLEHHMFPSVPYRNLPKLHALVRDDLPAPHRGVIHAYRDILPALWRQRRDLDHFIQTQIPSTSA